MTPIKDARAIVTGGVNGIGFQVCHRLLSKGAKAVAILDKDAARAPNAVTKLNTEFGKNRVFFLETDVSNMDQFEANFKKAVQQLGGLDIVVNDAGVINEVNWSLMIDVNVKGVIKGTLLALETMGKHKGGKGGTIVNVASTISLLPINFLPIYGGSKGAVLEFTRGIALSYDKTGVAMKAMCPGPVRTEFANSKEPRYLDFMDLKDSHKQAENWDQQTPEAIAHDIVHIAENMPNDTIWLNTRHNHKLSAGEIKIPDIEDLLV